jgi:hypothetical protein
MAYADMYEGMVAWLKSRCDVDDLDETEEQKTRELFRTTFGNMFVDLGVPTGELRAQEQYARERSGRIVVFSQHNRTWTPHGATSPFRFALLCTLPADAAPPPLNKFCQLEPCIVADDFSWAMVHTHEDAGEGAGMGGPYFINAEKVPSLTEPRLRRRRR